MIRPLTVTKLVRWRIRDWVSCFYACRFPLDEESEVYCSSSHPQTLQSTTGFDHMGNDQIGETDIGESVRCPEEITRIRLAENEVDDSSWPRCSEEDYIVFCFTENGAIHMVKETKLNRDYRSGRISRTVNRKLVYGENTEVGHSGGGGVSIEDKDIYLTNEEKSIITCRCRKGEEKRSIYLTNTKENTHEEEHKMVSGESSDQSDSSTSSFAFPVLRWEWMGSPEKMPKSEGTRLKARIARLHCCRF